MDEVQFEEEAPVVIRPHATAPKRKVSIGQFLIVTGIVRDQRQANQFMVSFALVAILAAGATYFLSQQPEFPPRTSQQIQNDLYRTN